jgi:hypothetical protein
MTVDPLKKTICYANNYIWVTQKCTLDKITAHSVFSFADVLRSGAGIKTVFICT